MADPKNAPGKKDERQPAMVDDDFDNLARPEEGAGTAGQVDTDSPIEVDGAEVSGITTEGDGHKGRKPYNGAA